MQLLIVHHDGEQLVQMVKDYTSHECSLVGSDAAALQWGRGHSKCALLITQLEAHGVDGLTLGGMLSEMFPGLQTLFLVGWQFVEFAYDRTVRPPVETIAKKWHEALIDAVEHNKKLKAQQRA